MFEMAYPSWYHNKVERPCAEHLEGDVDTVAAGVLRSRAWRGHHVLLLTVYLRPRTGEFFSPGLDR
jgi:hypothetical protein